MICTKCGNQIDDNIKFCIHCGNKLEVVQDNAVDQSQVATTTIKCGNCGKENADGAMFCSSCGSSLSGHAASTSSIYCYKCGAENSDDAQFCDKCGERLLSPNSVNNAFNNYAPYQPVNSETLVWKIILIIGGLLGMSFGFYTVYKDTTAIFGRYDYQSPLTNHEMGIIFLIIAS